ncbi:MAG TPA: hypothetical protein VGR47_04110 [Terracidiphilus sp.]|nr:hypothetical protein [Terracidiphilus sp.]
MPGSLFTHRSNSDGTTDSICNKCFTTVVTAIGEGELSRAEKLHVCDPAVLEYWRKLRDERQQVSSHRNQLDCAPPGAAA